MSVTVQELPPSGNPLLLPVSAYRMWCGGRGRVKFTGYIHVYIFVAEGRFSYSPHQIYLYSKLTCIVLNLNGFHDKGFKTT